MGGMVGRQVAAATPAGPNTPGGAAPSGPANSPQMDGAALAALVGLGAIMGENSNPFGSNPPTAERSRTDGTYGESPAGKLAFAPAKAGGDVPAFLAYNAGGYPSGNAAFRDDAGFREQGQNQPSSAAKPAEVEAAAAGTQAPTAPTGGSAGSASAGFTNAAYPQPYGQPSSYGRGSRVRDDDDAFSDEDEDDGPGFETAAEGTYAAAEGSPTQPANAAGSGQAGDQAATNMAVDGYYDGSAEGYAAGYAGAEGYDYAQHDYNAGADANSGTGKAVGKRSGRKPAVKAATASAAGGSAGDEGTDPSAAGEAATASGRKPRAVSTRKAITSASVAKGKKGGATDGGDATGAGAAGVLASPVTGDASDGGAAAAPADGADAAGAPASAGGKRTRKASEAASNSKAAKGGATPTAAASSAAAAAASGASRSRKKKRADSDGDDAAGAGAGGAGDGGFLLGGGAASIPMGTPSSTSSSAGAAAGGDGGAGGMLMATIPQLPVPDGNTKSPATGTESCPGGDIEYGRMEVYAPGTFSKTKEPWRDGVRPSHTLAERTLTQVEGTWTLGKEFILSGHKVPVTDHCLLPLAESGPVRIWPGYCGYLELYNKLTQLSRMSTRQILSASIRSYNRLPCAMWVDPGKVVGEFFVVSFILPGFFHSCPQHGNEKKTVKWKKSGSPQMRPMELSESGEPSGTVQLMSQFAVARCTRTNAKLFSARVSCVVKNHMAQGLFMVQVRDARELTSQNIMGIAHRSEESYMASAAAAAGSGAGMIGGFGTGGVDDGEEADV